MYIREIIEKRQRKGGSQKGLGRFFRRFVKTEAGVSLITTIIAVTMLSALGVSLISLSVSDSRVAVNHLSTSQALWLAEAGLERALRWLRYQDPPPGGTAVFTLYQNEELAGGTYTVEIDPHDDNVQHYIKQYTIHSYGRFGGATRHLEIQVRMNTFGRYAYLTGDEGYGTIWFTTGDVLEGPVHSNDQIAIYGSPTFLGRLTSSASSFKKGPGFDPTFAEGYQLNAPPVHFPTQQEIIDNYWAMNDQPPELIIDARFGKDASIEFNPDGTITYNVWHWEGYWWNKKKVYDIKDATANLSDLNGIIYVRGDVRVKGTVNGVVTLIATDNIYIVDDIVYADASPTGKPNPGCDDILGLISMKNVVIADTPPNRDDVVIDAAILALNSSFYVQNYDIGEPRGTIHLWGSLSQKVRGPVGTFSAWGRTGYYKDYHYDERFLDTPPPYYPTTGGYEVFSWREVDR